VLCLHDIDFMWDALPSQAQGERVLQPCVDSPTFRSLKAPTL